MISLQKVSKLLVTNGHLCWSCARNMNGKTTPSCPCEHHLPAHSNFEGTYQKYTQLDWDCDLCLGEPEGLPTLSIWHAAKY